VARSFLDRGPGRPSRLSVGQAWRAFGDEDGSASRRRSDWTMEVTVSVVDDLHAFLLRPATETGRLVRPPIRCLDGFRISVQASEYHYCEPRTNEGPWTHVELGFPSQVEPLLWPYAETPGKWTETVYPQVPVEIVAAVVELHGGFFVEDSCGPR